MRPIHKKPGATHNKSSDRSEHLSGVRFAHLSRYIARSSSTLDGLVKSEAKSMTNQSPGGADSRLLPEDAPVPTPEECIGNVENIDNVSYRWESIRAVGSKFVVFDLRNLKSGEIEKVVKVPREKFDPRVPLLHALPEAMDHVDQDPDRVIRICERWLELDPREETAFFNKGVALMKKNKIAQAVEAFTHAISLSPDDLWNLIHRASCFARLNLDRECWEDFLSASNQDYQQLTHCLRNVPGHSRTIQQSLKRLARADPSNPQVKQVLRDYFGWSLRVRQALYRLRYAAQDRT